MSAPSDPGPAPIEFSLELSADSAARWLFARDGRWPSRPVSGMPMPMSWAVFLRLQPVLCQRMHDLLGRDPDRGLYGGVLYRSHQALRVGQRLQARAEVTDRREIDSPRGRLTLTTLTTIYHCEGTPVLEEAVQMIDLPAKPAGEARSTAPPAPAANAGTVPSVKASDKADARGPSSSAAAATPQDDPALLIGRLPGGFDRTRIAWMTAETGDTNPLHLDRGYAAWRGFADVVVPAPLITAWVEQTLTAAQSGRTLSLLELRYQGPTLPDQPLELTRSDLTRPDRIELRAAGELRARGRFEMS